MRTHYCGTVRKEDIGKPVTLCGWVDRRRDHGGVIFVDLRDRSGVVQIVGDPERTPEAFQDADALRNEYVVRVSGTVYQRPDDSLNPKLPTGEIEVYADRIEVLNEVHKQLPFQVGTSEVEAVREELRLKYRYLDLRRDRMAQNLKLRHDTIKAIRRFLEDQQNFVEVETPVLTVPPPKAHGITSFPVVSTPANGSPFPNPRNCSNSY